MLISMNPASSSLDEKSRTLAEFYHTRKRLPSYAEMMKLFKFRSKNAVARVVGKFLAAGFVTKDSAGKLVPRRIRTPLKVLGLIHAGFPSPAEEELLDTLSLDEFLIRSPAASYLLRVSGDSMTEAGIHPGDLVIVERGRTARDGDIVIAQVDGEWTMKRYCRKGTKVLLKAANPKYPPIQPQEELIIGGTVIACIRKYASR